MWVDVLGTDYERKAPGKGKRQVWLMQCHCGQTAWVPMSDIKSGKSKQCIKCRQRKTGLALRKGEVHLKIKKAWLDMKRRCTDEKNKAYKNYGGRGITVCNEWLSSFINFKKWAIESGFKLGLTIERLNVNDNYCPENCTWIPKNKQNNNTLKNTFLTFKGKTQHLSAWARELGFNQVCLSQRLSAGWTTEEALTINPKLGSNQTLRKKE